MLAEIIAPVGSQDMMSQMRDYPFRQLTNQQSEFVSVATTSWDPTGAGIFANPGWKSHARIVDEIPIKKTLETQDTAPSLMGMLE